MCTVRPARPTAGVQRIRQCFFSIKRMRKLNYEAQCNGGIPCRTALVQHAAFALHGFFVWKGLQVRRREWTSQRETKPNQHRQAPAPPNAQTQRTPTKGRAHLDEEIEDLKPNTKAQDQGNRPKDTER